MVILDEEKESIEILEQDMQSWMNLSFKEIMSQWMTLLKRKHKEAMKTKKNNCDKNPGSETREVDYNNDRFVYELTIGDWEISSPILLQRSMAEYAFWLQHEHTRSRTRLSGITQEGWYERRMSWFRELMDVMQVRASEIVNEMYRIDIIETRSEKVDQKVIIEHFLASMKSTASGSDDKTA
ncbi:uncharacterized protein N7484_001283 [Penicillium longicatenatum]|uniref:uncharacterized protein n=1 Tax=Penicillium longicatenatum TaxID=1561947 RepID=UPI0025493F3B|nr:uncharacterized protein N7484_001283 [Penicillium longicatenatum]KAJ5657634.1 hypothetical protein N7484_001283 [Penicillium longicatenatum]